MSVALKPAARAWRFTDTEKQLPGFQIPGSCDSPVFLVVVFFHQTPPLGPNRASLGPFWILCTFHGVINPFKNDSPVFGNRGVVFLCLWTIKSLLLALKQHSFKKRSDSIDTYIRRFYFCFKNFPSPRFFGRLPGFLSTGESSKKCYNSMKR